MLLDIDVLLQRYYLLYLFQLLWSVSPSLFGTESFVSYGSEAERLLGCEESIFCQKSAYKSSITKRFTYSCDAGCFWVFFIV